MGLLPAVNVHFVVRVLIRRFLAPRLPQAVCHAAREPGHLPVHLLAEIVGLVLGCHPEGTGCNATHAMQVHGPLLRQLRRHRSVTCVTRVPGRVPSALLSASRAAKGLGQTCQEPAIPPCAQTVMLEPGHPSSLLAPLHNA